MSSSPDTKEAAEASTVTTTTTAATTIDTDHDSNDDNNNNVEESASSTTTTPPPPQQNAATKDGTAADIWSMRVQQELLALTTDNGIVPMGSDSENNKTPASSSTSSMLPPFISITDHALDIIQGTCVVTVAIDVVVAVVTTNETPTEEATTEDKEDDSSAPTTTTTPTTTKLEKLVPVMITMDLSLHNNSNKISSSSSYPFVPPIPRLISSSAEDGVFPTGSTIQTNDVLDMDIDWTPSLHLTDAILNIALKLRECVAQHEPIHPAAASSANNNDDDDDAFDENDAIDKVVGEVVDEVKKGARRFVSKLGSLGKAAFSSSKQQQSQPSTTKDATTPSSSSRRGGGARNLLSGRNRGNSNNNNNTTDPGHTSGGEGTPDGGIAGMVSPIAPVVIPPHNGIVKMGEEINLLEEPWATSAHGVYSCKAIRRPPFVEQVMMTTNHNTHGSGGRNTSNSVDHPGGDGPSFTSPTSMFRSLAQSAKSIMEETFLMITDAQIIELRTSKLNMQYGTVMFCIPIEHMAKLKFRRGESLSLFFKAAPDDPLIYMCPDSGDAVHQIQSVLKQKGVRGKHTNAAAYRAIHEALEIVKTIQVKETRLATEPSVEGVNEIMDLYRQAAEKFESAGDIRHEEVVTHMRKFLAKSSTIGILDASASASSATSSTSQLEPPKQHQQQQSMPAPAESSSTGSTLTPLSPNLESSSPPVTPIDLAAKYHFDDFDDDDDDDTNPEQPQTSISKDFSVDDIDDMAADLDAMMREADKELAELMNS